MSYTHLTTTERVKIETYLELGMSIRSIARRIGRQPSTVSREIRRNPGYESGRAQRRYEKAKTHCGAKTRLDDTMRRTIVEKLRATWTPEQIVGRLYAGKIAFFTIYRWIYAGRIDVPVTKNIELKMLLSHSDEQIELFVQPKSMIELDNGIYEYEATYLNQSDARLISTILQEHLHLP